MNFNGEFRLDRDLYQPLLLLEESVVKKQLLGWSLALSIVSPLGGAGPLSADRVLEDARKQQAQIQTKIESRERDYIHMLGNAATYKIDALLEMALSLGVLCPTLARFFHMVSAAQKGTVANTEGDELGVSAVSKNLMISGLAGIVFLRAAIIGAQKAWWEFEEFLSVSNLKAEYKRLQQVIDEIRRSSTVYPVALPVNLPKEVPPIETPKGIQEDL